MDAARAGRGAAAAGAGAGYGGGPAARLDAQVTQAINLLRGTRGHLLQVFVSFFAAIGMTFYGMARSSMDEITRRFFAMGVLFCVAQTMTLSKTLRDDLMASLQCHAAGQADFLKPTQAWLFQVWASFVAAVASSFYTLLTTAGDSDGSAWNSDRGFFVMATAFALAATVALAKAMRDRSDASAFTKLFATVPAGDAAAQRRLLRGIRTVTRGTSGNVVTVLVSSVGATVATLYGTFSMPELAMERKGFVLMGLLFMTASFFHLSKLVRDLADNELASHVHLGYRFLVVVSCLVSFAISFGGLYYMPMAMEQKRFVGCGMFFVLSCVLWLAKLVRDRADAAKAHSE